MRASRKRDLVGRSQGSLESGELNLVRSGLHDHMYAVRRQSYRAGKRSSRLSQPNKHRFRADFAVH